MLLEQIFLKIELQKKFFSSCSHEEISLLTNKSISLTRLQNIPLYNNNEQLPWIIKLLGYFLKKEKISFLSPKVSKLEIKLFKAEIFKIFFIW